MATRTASSISVRIGVQRVAKVVDVPCMPVYRLSRDDIEVMNSLHGAELRLHL